MLTPELLRQMDSYWRAANYLSVKPRPFRHRGTSAGLDFVYGFTRIAGKVSGPAASRENRPL
jgi:phosphoketolase